MFVNTDIWDFYLLQSSILYNCFAVTWLFHNVAGKSAAPFSLLHRSLPGQSVQLALCNINCVNSLWNVTVLRSCNKFYAPKKCLCFIKNKLSCSLRTFYVFRTRISLSSWKQTGNLPWKWLPMFMAVLSVPINHEHWVSTALHIQYLTRLLLSG